MLACFLPSSKGQAPFHNGYGRVHLMLSSGGMRQRKVLVSYRCSMGLRSGVPQAWFCLPGTPLLVILEVFISLAYSTPHLSRRAAPWSLSNEISFQATIV